jgi:glutamate-ammonia-ligase adenylyltransferase
MQSGSLADAVQRRWAAWRDRAREQGARVPESEAFVTTLQRVWEGSDYVAQSMERDPALPAALLDSGELLAQYGPGTLDRLLRDRLLDVRDEPALHRVLRLFRRRQMVRIIWRDLAGWATLEETLEDLSALADCCISRSLELLHSWQEAELGTPQDPDGNPQRMVVLGMGKLGARELNLSSDIDLIFTFPRRGPVQGNDRLSSEEYFRRLAQRLIQALDNQTVDGFVFRVDTRLRPFGESGPLVLSFGAMEEYYHSQAREWERYAMVKARAVAGEPAAVQDLMAVLRPFVYRRYLDFAAIESLREMKALISRELERKGLSDNVKLGPGGIREIEFIGQVFQIIRGGRETALQIRPIQPVLQLLGAHGLLPFYVVHELQSAYRFLRLVENRIQAWRDRQTHALPPAPEDRLRLARAMGYDDWDSFEAVLGRHRKRVQGHFDKVFAAPKAQGEERADSPYVSLWKYGLEGEQAPALLENAGFEHPAWTVQRLQAFRNSAACRNLGQRGRERMDHLMPMLLEAISGVGASDQILDRVLRLLEAIARRTAYLALLVENPVALSQLLRLIAISPWIGDQLSRHPLLLDELLDPRRLYSPLHREELADDLRTLMANVAPDDQEQQMERLRQFSQSNMLRVAAADLTGVIQVMVVSDYLTDIAEVTVQAVMDQCFDHLSARHGRPRGILGENTGFAVVGYGKLGGIELGYGSDLDLVFLHGNSDPQGVTDSARPIANDLFYARLAQRFIHMLGTRTPSGILYEVDTRLRPDGASGLLVSSLDAFAHYQGESAWTWEHQALLRARPVAGDPAVRARFNEIRRSVLSRERDPERLRSDVREMREKMRASLDRSGPDQFDLKQGHGGIADIEFMVQYAVLSQADRHPDLLDWTDNIRLLEGLARHDLMPGQRAEELADIYRALRTDYHRYSLQNQPGLVPAERLREERRRVRELWRELMLDD